MINTTLFLIFTYSEKMTIFLLKLRKRVKVIAIHLPRKSEELRDIKL